MSSTSSERERRKLKFRRWMLIGGTLLLGLAFVSMLAGFIERDDLTEIAGSVSKVERKKYWEDIVLYVDIEGVDGRFKYEHGSPGYAEFEAAYLLVVD